MRVVRNDDENSRRSFSNYQSNYSRDIKEIIGKTVFAVLGMLVTVVIAEEEAVVVSEAVTGDWSKQGLGMYENEILI